MQASAIAFDRGLSSRQSTQSLWGFDQKRLIVQSTSGRWRAEVERRLQFLCGELRQGWDGYTARPVSIANAFFAMRVIEAVCRDQTMPPQIVPGSSGDLQLEWHAGEEEIELHIIAPNKVKAWCSFVGVKGVELDLTNDFKEVFKWMRDYEELLIAD